MAGPSYVPSCGVLRLQGPSTLQPPDLHGPVCHVNQHVPGEDVPHFLVLVSASPRLQHRQPHTVDTPQHCPKYWWQLPLQVQHPSQVEHSEREKNVSEICPAVPQDGRGICDENCFGQHWGHVDTRLGQQFVEAVQR